MCKRCGKDLCGNLFGLILTRGTACVCVQRPPIGTFQGSMGRMASSFFLPHTEGVGGGFERGGAKPPCLCGDAPGVCTGWFLHLWASDYEVGSGGSHSPDLGDMWRHGCPVSPERFSSCSTSVTCCGGEEYEQAIQVVGQDWSSEVAVLFLEDWELGRVALSCHMAVDLLRQEMILSCVGWPVSFEF